MLVTFTEGILNGKLQFLCSDSSMRKKLLNLFFLRLRTAFFVKETYKFHLFHQFHNDFETNAMKASYWPARYYLKHHKRLPGNYLMVNPIVLLNFIGAC